MKFLHCSDIHLGRRPVGGVGDFSRKRYDDYFSAFAWVIETAITQNVDLVIISGDLFDRKELIPEVLERTETLLARLRDKAVPVLLTEGNHDNITPDKEDDSWIVYLQNKGLLQRPTYRHDDSGYNFNPINIDGHQFYGVGYPGGLANETLQALAEHLAAQPDGRNIILVHTAIAAGDFLPGTVDKETIDGLKDTALYIAGGHFHSYQVYPKNDPIFFIPGAPEYWDLAEPAERKGVIIFDTETQEHRFVPSQPRKKTALALKLQSENPEDFTAEFAAAIAALTPEHNEEIVFMKLLAAKPFYIDTTACEELLVNKGALKAFVTVSYPGQADTGSSAQQRMSVEEVEQEIIAAWELFSLKADETAHTLGKLKEYQKEGNRDQFLETFDGMLETVLNGEKSVSEDQQG
ncbi:MAG: exonuclease SbcCD subunit D [Deltaproteobacteria bacterium]|nr:exonuclease SbcCD subunit D [Deltaproteobacteria bacterium]